MQMSAPAASPPSFRRRTRPPAATLRRAVRSPAVHRPAPPNAPQPAAGRGRRHPTTPPSALATAPRPAQYANELATTLLTWFQMDFPEMLPPEPSPDASDPREPPAKRFARAAADGVLLASVVAMLCPANLPSTNIRRAHPRDLPGPGVTVRDSGDCGTGCEACRRTGGGRSGTWDGYNRERHRSRTLGVANIDRLADRDKDDTWADGDQRRRSADRHALRLQYKVNAGLTRDALRNLLDEVVAQRAPSARAVAASNADGSNRNASNFHQQHHHSAASAFASEAPGTVARRRELDSIFACVVQTPPLEDIVPSLHVGELILAVALLRRENAPQYVWSIKHVPSKALRLSVVRSLRRTSRLLGISDDHNLYVEISEGQPVPVSGEQRIDGERLHVRGSTFLRKGDELDNIRPADGQTAMGSFESSPSWALDSASDPMDSPSHSSINNAGIGVPPLQIPVNNVMLDGTELGAISHNRSRSAERLQPEFCGRRGAMSRIQSSFQSPSTPDRRKGNYGHPADVHISSEHPRQPSYSRQPFSRTPAIRSPGGGLGDDRPSLGSVPAEQGHLPLRNASNYRDHDEPRPHTYEFILQRNEATDRCLRDRGGGSGVPIERLEMYPGMYSPADTHSRTQSKPAANHLNDSVASSQAIQSNSTMGQTQFDNRRRPVNSRLGTDQFTSNARFWDDEDYRTDGSWQQRLTQTERIADHEMPFISEYDPVPNMSTRDREHITSATIPTWPALENAPESVWAHLLRPTRCNPISTTESLHAGFPGNLLGERSNPSLLSPAFGQHAHSVEERTTQPHVQNFDIQREEWTYYESHQPYEPQELHRNTRRSSGLEPVAFLRHRNSPAESYQLHSTRQSWDLPQENVPYPVLTSSQPRVSSPVVLQRPHAPYSTVDQDLDVHTGHTWDERRHQEFHDELYQDGLLLPRAHQRYDLLGALRSPTNNSRRAPLGLRRRIPGTRGYFGGTQANYTGRLPNQRANLYRASHLSSRRDNHSPLRKDAKVAHAESSDIFRDNVSNMLTCVVCLTAEVDTAIKPCFHAKFCESCATRIKNSSGQCPLCRCSILDLQRIFF